MIHLELSRVSKVFGETRAVHDLSLAVNRGEILSLLGPSGCGKTTTLRMIAGLELPTSGSIHIAGHDLTRVPARSRNMGMVFQNYALFPHLNIFENVAFGLRVRKLPESETAARVAAALERVRLPGYEKRQPHQLSGGQQQRIALARALATQPDVLLLDEPLSNLDPSLREDLRDQIRAVIHDLEMTAVFVTHDQQEAFALADRVAILQAGVCRQIGTPLEVYNRPASPFVAGFLGKANLLTGRRVDSASVELAPGFTLNMTGHAGGGTELQIVIRPENVRMGASDGIPAHIVRSVFEGEALSYTLEACGVRLIARRFHHGEQPLQDGSATRIAIESFVVL